MPLWTFFSQYLKRSDSDAEAEMRAAQQARDVRRNAWALAGPGRQTAQFKRITQPASGAHPAADGPPPPTKGARRGG